MNEGSVRFAVEQGFFVCANALFELPLPTVEKLTYMALCRYAGSNNRAWPSYATLAEDVSSGRKRTIKAVNLLVECGLVEKVPRGNRTNIYLLYPPSYFKNPEKKAADDRGGVSSGHPESVDRTPPEKNAVSSEHPEGVHRTPPGCRQDTVGVLTGHPKSNNKNNRENSSLTETGPLQDEEERGEALKSKSEQPSEKRESLNKNEKEEIEEIKRAFKANQAQATDAMVKSLLKNYSCEAIKAAINYTDFKVARNPLSVIRWALSNETYLLPAEKDNPPPEPEPLKPDPDEDRAIREMIRKAREKLKGGAPRPVSACPS